TEARMMRLFRQLSEEGRSLICITHNVDNVDRCHLVLVLAHGKLIYYGPPADAPAFFQVGRISEIYDRIAERGMDEGEAQFLQSESHQEFVARRLQGDALKPMVDAPPSARLVVKGDSSAGAAPSVVLTAGEPARRPKRPPLWHQFRVLTARY